MKLPLATASLLVLAALLMTGCGGGDSATGEAAKQQKVDWSLFPKGPTRQFIIPNGDNAVQTYGREGTPAERAAVSRVLHAWLRARAAKNWAKDCSYLSRYYIKMITADAHSDSKGKVSGCAATLAYFKGNASGDFANNLPGQIQSLRVGRGEGRGEAEAYAQYHGNDGKDWVVPVTRENGEWRVANAKPFNRLN